MRYCRDCFHADPIECERLAMAVDIRDHLECGCNCHDEINDDLETEFFLGEYLDCDVLNLQKPLQMEDE